VGLCTPGDDGGFQGRFARLHLCPSTRPGPKIHDSGPGATLVSMDAVSLTRLDLVRRGQRLEYFTIAYNSLEGLVSIVAGLIAGSVSLVGFGLDSAIEVASGAALLWRLHHDLNPSRREQVERITLRIVGWCFIALAAYIVYECGSTLVQHEAPERSIPGIIVAAVSVVVLPFLAKAKQRAAESRVAGLELRLRVLKARDSERCFRTRIPY
jgi:hypothetical protein